MPSLTVRNSEPFLHQVVIYDKMWILWQPAMTSSAAGLRRGSEHFHGKKKGHGHCLVVSCWSDPPQLSESWQNHDIWEVCSANRREAWTLQWLQLALVNRKGPIFLSTAQPHVLQQVLQKLNKLACEILPHPSYIHLISSQSATIFSSILTAFCRENTSTTSRRQKMPSKSV